MAVVNSKSALVSNYDAQPRILSSGYQAGAPDAVAVATVAAAATDSIGSTYRFGFISSGVRVGDIAVMNDATTAGVWQLGVYCQTNVGLNMGGISGGKPLISVWSSTVAYVPGNVVQYAGVIYYCTTGNTNSVPPSGNWTTGGAVNAAAGSVPIPNSLVIFNSGFSTAAANATFKSVYSPSVGAVGNLAANAILRIWELLGFAQDPFYEFHLVATATTAPTAAGNITLKWSWAR